MCGMDGETYQNGCFCACSHGADPRRKSRTVRCPGACPCRKNFRGMSSRASTPKESSLGAVVEANKYDAAVEALEFDEAMYMASPEHGPEAGETTPSADKLTMPKDGEQSNKKPDAIETTFRLADSNKDGVQDLAEFRGLEDVEDVVRKLFQHYDQVWLRQQYVSAKIQIYRMETRKCHSRNIE